MPPDPDLIGLPSAPEVASQSASPTLSKLEQTIDRGVDTTLRTAEKLGKMVAKLPPEYAVIGGLGLLWILSGNKKKTETKEEKPPSPQKARQILRQEVDNNTITPSSLPPIPPIEAALNTVAEAYQGSFTPKELRELDYPQFKTRILAGKAIPKATPLNKLLERAGNQPPIKVGLAQILENIAKDNMVGQKLPNKSCAFYVSKYLLGLEPPVMGSTSLLTRLMKEPANRVVPDPKNLRKGDIVFWRGTYGGEENWGRASHVGVVVAASADKITIRHQGGFTITDSTMPLDEKSENTYYRRHFYVGIRPPEIV